MNTLKLVRWVHNSYARAHTARFIGKTVPCNRRPYVAGAKRSAAVATCTVTTHVRLKELRPHVAGTCIGIYGAMFSNVV